MKHEVYAAGREVNLQGPLKVTRDTCRRTRLTNPKNPQCALALRRICGVCAHFMGPLKPSAEGHNPRAALVSRCAEFDVAKHAHRCAADCPRWTRKTAPGGKP